MSSYIHLNFHYLPFETNLRFLAITVLELKAKTSLKKINWENVANLHILDLI